MRTFLPASLLIFLCCNSASQNRTDVPQSAFVDLTNPIASTQSRSKLQVLAEGYEASILVTIARTKFDSASTIANWEKDRAGDSRWLIVSVFQDEKDASIAYSRSLNSYRSSTSVFILKSEVIPLLNERKYPAAHDRVLTLLTQVLNREADARPSKPDPASGSCVSYVVTSFFTGLFH